MSLFERFADDQGHRVRGLVAYGLYKTAKREWVTEFAERSARAPTAADVDAYTVTWTPSMIEGKRAEASQVLQEFADNIVAAERPAIVEQALRGSAAKAISLNIAAAFLYTLVLIGVVVVLRYAGVDLLSLAAADTSSG